MGTAKMAYPVRVMSPFPFFLSSSSGLFLDFLFPFFFPVQGALLSFLARTLETLLPLRSSIDDYMQVLCYIAMHANKPSCLPRYIACLSCVPCPAYVPR